MKDATGTCTIAGFAQRCGVSKQAIYKAIEDGRIVRDENNRIDPTDEINAGYLEHRANSAPAMTPTGRGQPLKIAGGSKAATQRRKRVAPTVDSTAVDDVRAAGLDYVLKNKILDAELKQAKIKKADLEYAESVKRVIPREVVARAFSEIAALLNENFRSFDDANGAELYEIAREKDQREFSDALARHINDAMRTVISGVDAAIERIAPPE